MARWPADWRIWFLRFLSSPPLPPFVFSLSLSTHFSFLSNYRSLQVIHAGLYYRPGTLKSKFCVQGRELLYAYCAERGIPHRRCGKLVVATAPEQHAQLADVMATAIANGVLDIAWLEAAEAQALEPALTCTAALESPSTGIIDSHSYMLSLQGDIEAAGGSLVFNTLVEQVDARERPFRLRTPDMELETELLVNSAGLQAQQLARSMLGLPAWARPLLPRRYARGTYFDLTVASPFQHLIYPLPTYASLGVHLTLDLAGRARFGPDLEWIDTIDYHVDPARGDAFYAAIRQYWPGLPDGVLQAAYAGIRAKVQNEGESACDFVIQQPLPGLVNLLGIESPGLTSSLAIAQYVEELLLAP